MEATTRSVTIYTTTDGREFTSRCNAQEHETRVTQSKTLWDAASEPYRALRAVMRKHNASGVCDSEGEYTVDRWIRRSLLGEFVKRITFEGLEGYTEYKPKEGQLKKGEIAREIAKAAHEVVRAVKTAARANKIRLTEDVVERLL